MKYGEYLKSQKIPEWEEAYMDYDTLKNMIKGLEEAQLLVPVEAGIGTSLSIPAPTNAAGVHVKGVTQEEFFSFLESQMKKIEHFTKLMVDEVRTTLADAERKLNLMLGPNDNIDLLDSPEGEECRAQVEVSASTFLKLEKFVNLNFMGFSKILKKHDKRLPNPCRAFYLGRLHEQSWIRGDYSDVMVTLSRIYSRMRKDTVKQAKETAKENFCRSTRKYWVHTEDISSIKYTILQHLPVFLQTGMDGESDSQLTTSIYLDNYAMELYRGRLDKSPGAIALRLRWYGNRAPENVYVERKTHKEKWTGEMSIKERFTIKERQVMDLLQGRFDLNGEINRLKEKGKSQEDINDYKELASETIQAINSKQLFPTMRTQYMRAAFQIPFDPSVRISLDTNLTMITERTSEVISGERWYRDPQQTVPSNEINRFPHGVLEIKLQLEDESQTPSWVTDLINSGKLLEIHKFSKFIHGCAVLLPDDVPAIPYWVDDVTLADSIIKSGGAKLLETDPEAAAKKQENPLLPHDANGIAKAKLRAAENSNTAASIQTPPISSAPLKLSSPKSPSSPKTTTATVPAYQAKLKAPTPPVSSPMKRNKEDTYYQMQDLEAQNGSSVSCWDYCCPCTPSEVLESDLCNFAKATQMTKNIPAQKVEPKVFFANERTFLSWLNMAVFMSSMSIAVMAFASNNASSIAFALILMPMALLFIGYALNTYLNRGTKISNRNAERWDDPFGPPLLAGLLAIALTAIFIVKIVQLGLSV